MKHRIFEFVVARAIPFFAVAVVANTVYAQHSDIGIYQNADQQVVSIGSDDSVRRVFVRSFDFFGHPFGNASLPRVYSGDDPGFVAGSPPSGFDSLPGRAEVLVDFIAFDMGSGTGNLFYWNGEGDVSFASPPQGHTLTVTDNFNREFILDGSGSAASGGVATVTDSQGHIHDHVQFRLDDNDGNQSTEPSRGIYVLGAEFGVEGLMSSEPLVIGLVSPDVQSDTQDQAVDWLEANLESMQFGLFGDFNNSGSFDLEDIDQLVQAIADGSNASSYDLTADGIVTADDLNQWRALAGETLLGADQSIAVGDANLDGFVNEFDLDAWSSNRFTETPAWSAGDFNADGFVDVSDFNLWNRSRPAASLVPEPNGALFLLVCLVPLLHRKEQPT